MSELIDLIGKRFGRLVVIQRMNNNKRGQSRWLCQCNCRKITIILGDSLRRCNTQSCGCLLKEKTAQRFVKHNCWNDKIYKIWAAIIQRCTNSNHKNWKYYGGRGIIVCERWRSSFENFNEDMGKEWKFGLQIERKNNNKGYYKNNCYWATRKQQARNKRDNCLEIYKGKTQCITAWAEEFNIHPRTLHHRIRKLGWSIEKALITPIRKRKR